MRKSDCGRHGAPSPLPLPLLPSAAPLLLPAPLLPAPLLPAPPPLPPPPRARGAAPAAPTAPPRGAQAYRGKGQLHDLVTFAESFAAWRAPLGFSGAADVEQWEPLVVSGPLTAQLKRWGRAVALAALNCDDEDQEASPTALKVISLHVPFVRHLTGFVPGEVRVEGSRAGVGYMELTGY